MVRKLSIVIPVYNVEKYLSECLDSVLIELNDDYCEVILVDDGSKDSSGTICDEYSKIYSNVFVIHKQNGGLASARNAGLSVAHGEYVCFIDSDDKIAKNGIKNLLDAIEHTDFDICFMQCVKFFPDGATDDMGDSIFLKDILNKSREEVVCFLATRPKYPGSACTKIYRREFLIQFNICFPKTPRFSEDLGFVLDCIIKAKSFFAIDSPYYEYRQNRIGSITNVIDEKKFKDLMLFIVESLDKVKNEDKNSNLRQMVLNFVVYEYAILIMLYSKLDKKYKKEAIKKLKEYKHLLKEGKTLKLKIIKWFAYIFGIKVTSKILNMYIGCK